MHTGSVHLQIQEEISCCCTFTLSKSIFVKLKKTWLHCYIVNTHKQEAAAAALLPVLSKSLDGIQDRFLENLFDFG